MRRLRGGIPRALKSHKGADGAAYRAYTEPMLERLVHLDRAGLVMLREAGLVNLEMIRTARELEQVRLKPNRRREERRLRRVAASLRGQLVMMERRLEEIAAASRHRGTLAERLNQGADVPPTRLAGRSNGLAAAGHIPRPPVEVPEGGR